ncbi:hypothetical protein [Abyssibacter sp.]|jgi:hypothetical protein|uniref:hypothetical protein n=1 Tax=Abyssibacter sp. TaxID=2320200 RepID=UPI000C5953A2|nr:hypothetical protein [Abyssibacter sp.]MBB87859.1 hypothetical protein [Xanthomonadales bacterium]MCK5860618.1 hypothetical protein [Abyssibacter sp.]
MIHRQGFWVLGLVACAMTTSACANSVDIERIDDPNAEFSLVNGAIKIGPNSRVGDLETVNGSVSVGDSSRVGDIEVVNGSIKLGERVRVEDIESVNGGIHAGSGLTVIGGVESVNGDIRLGSGATVKNGIETVNGEIVFTRSRIEGGIETVNSPLDTGTDSVILGDIVYEETNHGSRHVPRVVIGPGTRVEGDLRFYREVNLEIHETAKITGRIHRAWSGAESARL